MTKTRSIKKDIAIIGMSGRFPGSGNVREFWNHLSQGNELVRFYSDEELEHLGVSPELIRSSNYVKGSVFIEEPGSFDHAFFGYTKEEAALMDPQVRIFHEQAWLSLEDAGYNPFSYTDKIGCFFSASDNVNWRTHVMLSGATHVNPFLVRHLSDKNSISRLISYALNLKGPSYFVDTVCSSSLVAVHIACRSLLMRECSLALAGGVSVRSSTGAGYMYEEGMIFSRDGHCKAFDKDASGTIGGEGAGIVVLKRLEEALNDGDHIYSVIRASSVNNDGNRKVGYTAPSVVGQYECIRMAQQIAEVDYKEISYIEAHGTGTKLGDPVEIEALNKAFNYDTSHACGIGSLKTNIGHLDAAAGVAGLIKTALSLNKKMLLPSLHFTSPNPEINFRSGPFYVNTALKEWGSKTSRLAGVSSFGIGGTNAHVILEEPPQPRKSDPPKAYQLLLYAAKTRSSLKRYRQSLAEFLSEDRALNLADLSYTLKTRKSNFRYRSFVVCPDAATAEFQLKENNPEEPYLVKDKKNVVFMFSGQGSQYYGMGRQLYEQYSSFKQIMDEGFKILQHETGTDYAEVLGYRNPGSSPDELINDTVYTQPLLFLLEYAFAAWLLQLDVQPSHMIGHSLGEYVAACISGVFTFEQGLRLIVKRAHLMNALERGVMMHVELPADKMAELITARISIAAVNTEHTCVVSGNTADMDKLSEVLSSRDIAFIRLKTSHAFHSEMMDPVLEAYRAELRKVTMSAPKYPFISCVTGAPVKHEEAMSPDYWVRHLRDTVQFARGLDFLLDEKFQVYLEIGSAKSLLSFLRQNKRFSPELSLSAVLRHPKENQDDPYCFLKALGTLWGNGIDIHWNAYYAGEQRNKIPAPAYAFDKVVFPARVNPIQKFMELNAGYLKSAAQDEEAYRSFRLQSVTAGDTESEVALEETHIVERPGLKSEYQEPVTETEKALEALWCSLFGYDKIGVLDDFFELGGDSLKVLTVLKRIHKIFNVEIVIGDFYKKSNISMLAREIELATELKKINKTGNPSQKSNQVRL